MKQSTKIAVGCTCLVFALALIIALIVTLTKNKKSSTTDQSIPPINSVKSSPTKGGGSVRCTGDKNVGAVYGIFETVDGASSIRQYANAEVAEVYDRFLWKNAEEIDCSSLPEPGPKLYYKQSVRCEGDTNVGAVYRIFETKDGPVKRQYSDSHIAHAWDTQWNLAPDIKCEGIITPPKNPMLDHPLLVKCKGAVYLIVEEKDGLVLRSVGYILSKKSVDNFKACYPSYKIPEIPEIDCSDMTIGARAREVTAVWKAALHGNLPDGWGTRGEC